MVGERLGRIVMKHTYGDESLVADCPRVTGAERVGNDIVICFADSADGLCIKVDLKEYLKVKCGDDAVDYEASADKDRLILKGDFSKEKVTISFCESNYCIDPLYNSEGNPVFAFTLEV